MYPLSDYRRRQPARTQKVQGKPQDPTDAILPSTLVSKDATGEVHAAENMAPQGQGYQNPGAGLADPSRTDSQLDALLNRQKEQAQPQRHTSSDRAISALLKQGRGGMVSQLPDGRWVQGSATAALSASESPAEQLEFLRQSSGLDPRQLMSRAAPIDQFAPTGANNFAVANQQAQNARDTLELIKGAQGLAKGQTEARTTRDANITDLSRVRMGEQEIKSRLDQEIMRGLTGLEQERVRGEYGLRKADADQKALTTGALTQGIVSAIQQGGVQSPEESEATLQRMAGAAKRTQELLREGGSGGAGSLQAPAMNPALIAAIKRHNPELGSVLEAQQTAVAPAAPAAPAATGGGATGASAKSTTNETVGQRLLRAGNMAGKQKLTTPQLLERLGITVTPGQGLDRQVNYAGLRAQGVPGAIKQLSSDPDLITDEQIDEVENHLVKSGVVASRDLADKLVRDYVRNVRLLNYEQGGPYQVKTGSSTQSSLSTDPMAYLRWSPTVNALGHIPGLENLAGRNVTLLNELGNPSFVGREAAGFGGLAELAGGMQPILPAMTPSGISQARRQRDLVGRWLQRIKAREQQTQKGK